MNSKKTVSAVLATALVLSVTSSAAFASNSSKNSADYVYGTMKISYHDFYLGENVDTTKGVTSTDYVDAVSSATMNKGRILQKMQTTQWDISTVLFSL